ncbi:MAG: hypothetical protein JWO81_210 [Alphaproteobacteria bacterium]|nr:hypothetical protein [Alphaproteobacteria bacterium]
MNTATGRRWDETRRWFAREARSLPAFALVALLVAWCWPIWSSPPYSPDSWAYYELSRSIWRGGFRLLELRSYAYPAAAPSGAFPPLWPALWWLVAAPSGLGARAGLIASFSCIAALAMFSEAIGRQLSGVKWVGLAAAGGLFAMPGFAEEVDAARSIPLQMALISGLIWTLLRRGPIGPARAAAMGIICGALVLTRFDMLAFAIVFGLIVLFLSRSLGATSAFGLLFIAAVSPWVTLSWLWFGELFHSDSSFVASAIDPRTFVTDWYPPARHRATLGDDPVAWAYKVAGNVPPFLRSAMWSPGPLGQAELAAALAALLARGREVGHLISSFRTADASVRRFAAAAPAIVAPLPLYVATGYFDARYFSLVFWYALMAVSTLAAVAWLPRAGRGGVESRTMLLALGMLLVAGCANVTRGLARPPQPGFPELQEFAPIGMCLDRLGAHPTDRILFQDDTLAARWAAVRRRPAAILPLNFTRPGISFAEKGQFLAEHDIRFLVGEPEVLEPIFKPFLQGPALSCGAAVYRLAPAA